VFKCLCSFFISIANYCFPACGDGDSGAWGGGMAVKLDDNNAKEKRKRKGEIMQQKGNQ
jgi:hypothetical protein